MLEQECSNRQASSKTTSSTRATGSTRGGFPRWRPRAPFYHRLLPFLLRSARIRPSQCQPPHSGPQVLHSTVSPTPCSTLLGATSRPKPQRVQITHRKHHHHEHDLPYRDRTRHLRKDIRYRCTIAPSSAAVSSLHETKKTLSLESHGACLSGDGASRTSAAEGGEDSMAERRRESDRIRSPRIRAKSDRATMPGNLVSPPGSTTPPTGRNQSKILPTGSASTRQRSRHGSEPIDAGALAQALKDFEDVGRQRERTPGSSPCRKRQRVYGDRYAFLLRRSCWRSCPYHVGLVAGEEVTWFLLGCP